MNVDNATKVITDFLTNNGDNVVNTTIDITTSILGALVNFLLALVFSVLGYLIGFLAAVLDDGAAMEKVVFGTYLISGTTLAVCTLLHFKASGHTCGCSGPIAALSIFINPWFLVGYVLLTPIIWSSIRLKRHTALQLLAGCVIPVLAMLICRAQFL